MMEMLVCHSDSGIPVVECNYKRLYSLPEAFKGSFEQCTALGVGQAHILGTQASMSQGPSIKSSGLHTEVSLTKTLNNTGH